MTPAHRSARTPGATRHLCGGSSRLAAFGSTAPRGPPVLEVDGCGPRQRIAQFATGWPALLRPALRRYAEREPDAFDRLLLPTASSTTSTRASVRSRHLSEAFASPLRSRACTLGDGDRGTWRFTTPDPLRRAAPGWHRGVFFRVLPAPPSLRHPCRLPVAQPRSSRGPRSTGGAETVQCKRSVTEPPATTIRGAFHRRPPARTRGPPPLSRAVT